MTATVIIEAVAGCDRCVRMVWERHVNPIDVMTAFRCLRQMLDTAQSPLYVMIVSDPKTKFPLSTTLMGVRTVLRHPKLAGWLIVDANEAAKAIVHGLALSAGDDRFHLFDSEADALAFVTAEEQQSA